MRKPFHIEPFDGIILTCGQPGRQQGKMLFSRWHCNLSIINRMTAGVQRLNWQHCPCTVCVFLGVRAHRGLTVTHEVTPSHGSTILLLLRGSRDHTSVFARNLKFLNPPVSSNVTCFFFKYLFLCFVFKWVHTWPEDSVLWQHHILRSGTEEGYGMFNTAVVVWST